MSNDFKVCETCECCDETVKLYEKGDSYWCETCAEQVPCKDCGCWYFETEDGLCDDCLYKPQPVRIRRDAKANPTIEDWEGKYGGFKLWNENWKLWNTYESNNDTIMEAMLVGAYFTLNRCLEYLPPNLPNTKRYKKLQQQIKSWKEYVAENPLPPPREA